MDHSLKVWTWLSSNMLCAKERSLHTWKHILDYTQQHLKILLNSNRYALVHGIEQTSRENRLKKKRGEE